MTYTEKQRRLNAAREKFQASARSKARQKNDPLPKGHGRRLTDARCAWKYMTDEQRQEFLLWIAQYGEPVPEAAVPDIAVRCFASRYGVEGTYWLSMDPPDDAMSGEGPWLADVNDDYRFATEEEAREGIDAWEAKWASFNEDQRPRGGSFIDRVWMVGDEEVIHHGGPPCATGEDK